MIFLNNLTNCKLINIIYTIYSYVYVYHNVFLFIQYMEPNNSLGFHVLEMFFFWFKFQFSLSALRKKNFDHRFSLTC